MKVSIQDEVEAIFNEEIRPVLASHAGNIMVVDYSDGVLLVRLTGQCSGCPSALLETEDFINSKIKAGIPQIRDVVLMAGVSDELMNQAKAMLHHEFPA
jgi:Fe-S cluster biogenesis protein NfuA